MANDGMYQQMSAKPGFIAALDQSGGSTPGALRAYGVPDSAWHGDEAEMFGLMHEMRVRIMTSPSFTNAAVIGAILFERTMDGDVKGKPVPAFLWQERGVVPFLKVDKGLEAEMDGVALMKPIPASTPCSSAPSDSASSAPRCARRSTSPRSQASRRSSPSSSRLPARSRRMG